jgi:hypothetical protein
VNPSFTSTKLLTLTAGVRLHSPRPSTHLLTFGINVGRPQRDGPALRATTFMLYANYLIANGNITWVTKNLWPVIKLDLDYVQNYWNRTTYASACTLLSVADADQFRSVGGDRFFFVLDDRRPAQGAEGGYCSRRGPWSNGRHSWVC